MRTVYPKDPPKSFNEWMQYIKQCNDESNYSKKD